jgi:hypothetical protein
MMRATLVSVVAITIAYWACSSAWSGEGPKENLGRFYACGHNLTNVAHLL